MNLTSKLCLVSTALILFFGTMQLVSFIVPWHIRTICGGGRTIESLSGYQTMFDGFYMYGHPKYVMIFVPLSGLLCVMTPFLTNRMHKHSARAPLYIFYSFLASLVILDIYYTIQIGFRGVPEEVVIERLDYGFYLSLASTIGMVVGAVSAGLHNKPAVRDRPTMLMSVSLGILIVFSFFFLNFFYIHYSWPHYPSGKTGFNLAYHQHDLLHFLFSFEYYYQVKACYLASIVLYAVPVAGFLVLISSFFHKENFIRLASAGILTLISFLFLFTKPPESGLEYSPAEGVWLCLGIGIFLLLIETSSYLRRRTQLRSSQIH